MTTTMPMPSQFHWTPEQLAAAVPLRLHQCFTRHTSATLPTANAAGPQTLRQRGYCGSTASRPAFRIL